MNTASNKNGATTTARSPRQLSTSKNTADHKTEVRIGNLKQVIMAVQTRIDAGLTDTREIALDMLDEHDDLMIARRPPSGI